MNVPIVRKLALESSRAQIDEAVTAFEKTRANLRRPRAPTTARS